ACGSAPSARASSSRGPRRGESGRVEILADAVECLSGVARREPLELTIDAEAWSDFELARAHACVEAVERARGRSSRTHPADVVYAAVARADESFGGRDEVHGTANVHAPARDRHEAVEAIFGLGVNEGVPPTDVHGRLTRLADAGSNRDHPACDGAIVEVARRTDRLPVRPSSREHGSEGEAERGKRDGSGSD